MLAKISSFLIVSSLAMMSQALPVPSLNLNTTAFVMSGEFLNANTTKGNFIDAVSFESLGLKGSANFSIVVDVANEQVWAWATIKGKANGAKIAETLTIHTNFTNLSYSIYSGSSKKSCSISSGTFVKPYSTVAAAVADFNMGANSNYLSNDGSFALSWIGAATYQVVSFSEQGGDGYFFLDSSSSIVALAIAPSHSYFGLPAGQYQAGLVYDISTSISKK